MGARSEQGHARFHAGLLRKGGQVTKPDLGLAGDGDGDGERGGLVDFGRSRHLRTVGVGQPASQSASQPASQENQPAKVALPDPTLAYYLPCLLPCSVMYCVGSGCVWMCMYVCSVYVVYGK